MQMRDLVDLATSEPPPLRYTVDDIIESGQRAGRRRRIGWAGSGATAVVALGVTAAVVLPSLAGGPAPVMAGTSADPSPSVSPSPSAAAQPFPVSAPPFAFTFAGYQVGKVRVAQPIDVSTAYQISPMYVDGLTTNDRPADPNSPQPSQFYGYLVVYRPGAYDPSRLRGGQSVTIAGRPGLELDGSGAWASMRTLGWQYAPNAWAVITAYSSYVDNPSAADLRQVAAGLRPAAPAEATVPIKLGYVPSGYHLDEVAMHAMAGLNGIAAAREGDYAGLVFSKPALPTTRLSEPFGGTDGADPPGSFIVFVVPAANSNQHASPGVTCLTGFCNRWVDGGRVNLQVASEGRLPNGEMKKILNGITIGDVHDDSTWTPVSSAIS
jgi:hypothetical protein